MEQEKKNNEEQVRVNQKVCGEKCEVWSRVVGYFRPVKDWNNGKKEEFYMRKKFKLDSKPKEKENHKEELSALTV